MQTGEIGTGIENMNDVYDDPKSRVVKKSTMEILRGEVRGKDWIVVLAQQNRTFGSQPAETIWGFAAHVCLLQSPPTCSQKAVMKDTPNAHLTHPLLSTLSRRTAHKTNKLQNDASPYVETAIKRCRTVRAAIERRAPPTRLAGGACAA